METQEGNEKRYPNFLDSLKSEIERNAQESQDAMQALIDETRQACLDCGISLEEWDGIPRREIRDDLK